MASDGAGSVAVTNPSFHGMAWHETVLEGQGCAVQSRGGHISHLHYLAARVPSREIICRTLPVGDLNDERVWPLTAQRRLGFCVTYVIGTKQG